MKYWIVAYHVLISGEVLDRCISTHYLLLFKEQSEFSIASSTGFVESREKDTEVVTSIFHTPCRETLDNC